MKKKCPICQTELNTNCYVKDNGTAALSYLELIIKNDNLKKEIMSLNVVTALIVDMWNFILI